MNHPAARALAAVSLLETRALNLVEVDCPRLLRFRLEHLRFVLLVGDLSGAHRLRLANLADLRALVHALGAELVAQRAHLVNLRV